MSGGTQDKLDLTAFQRLAEIHGGDLARWPEPLQAQARRALDETPGARAALEAEAALDAALAQEAVAFDALEPEPLPAAFAARLMADAETEATAAARRADAAERAASARQRSDAPSGWSIGETLSALWSAIGGGAAAAGLATAAAAGVMVGVWTADTSVVSAATEELGVFDYALLEDEPGVVDVIDAAGDAL